MVAMAVDRQLIAHRGASAYAPEHSSHAYRLAIEMGADFVEQDLAVTRDGVLVCIHDLTLERTTNVAGVFPDRKPWRVHDFTLAEIKQLDAGSWFDAIFADARILTFDEAIEIVRPAQGIGLYPELKDPAFYRGRGANITTLLIESLRKNGLPDTHTPVIIQSFDEIALKQAAREMPSVPRVYLLETSSANVVDSSEKVRGIAAWATGLGPDKAIVDTRPEVVRWAHDAGLTVTPWTFRSADTPFASVRDEMAKFLYDYGVDALFTDNPDMFPRRR